MTRVVVFSVYRAFGQGVVALLARETGIEIACPEADAEQALAYIKELHPDAIIIDTHESVVDPATVAASILVAGVAARVIGLNLQDNTLSLYRGAQRVIQRVEDLSQVIRYDAATVENAKNKTLERMAAVPACRLVLYKMLVYCETFRSTSDLEERILSWPEMKAAIYSPTVLMGWLEETGGLERVVVDKEEPRWQTTQAGQQVAEVQAPAKRLLELLAKEPAYRDLYLQVLEFCATPRAKSEIESLLEGNLAMVRPKLYPTFFVQGLEEAGGLEWVGNWQITDAGRAILPAGQ